MILMSKYRSFNVSGENNDSVELYQLENGYQARPTQVFTPPQPRNVRMAGEGFPQDGSVVQNHDFAPGEHSDEERGQSGERQPLLGDVPLVVPQEPSGDLESVFESVNASRCPNASRVYRGVVHFVAKDLQDHNADFPFRLMTTEWPRVKNFVAGSAFVANKLWAPAFWGMLTWDIFAGAVAANPLYGIRWGNILAGLADDPITVTSTFGSDVAGESLYYLPALLGVAAPIVIGGGVWASDFLRAKLEPKLDVLAKGVPRSYRDWKGGNASLSWRDVPFWSIVLGTLYADARLIELFILKIIRMAEFFAEQEDCVNQGKQWAYLNDWGNFECVVSNAEFLADYQKFTADAAIQGLLDYSQDPEFILRELDALLEFSFQKLDLSGQQWRNWRRSQFKALLSKVSSHTKSLTGLNMSSPILQTSFPDDGRLADVAEFLRNVTTRSVSIKNQGIGQAGLEQLWDALVRSTTEIEVDGNNIQLLPAPLNATKITRLSASRTLLSDAGVSDLAQGLSNGPVAEIDLSDVGMSGVGIVAVSEVLPRTVIKKLSVANNNFQDVDMMTVGQNVADSTLEAADFSATQLDDTQVDSLTAPPSQNMKSWKFRNNGITNFGMFKTVGNCRNTSVASIDFFGNAIDDDGVSSSIGFLSETSLNTLGLGNTQITAESIALLGQSGKITSVDVSQNQIGPEVVNKLIQNKTFFECLDLTATGLDTDSGMKLIGVLPGSRLKSLILANNDLHDPVLLAFANILPESGVVFFDIHANQLTDVSATAVAKMLPRSVLKQFNIGHNRLSDSGAVAVVRSLVEPTPASDSIGDENVGRYEARALRKAKLSVALNEVDVEGNKVGRSTTRAAQQVLSGKDFTFKSNSTSQFYSNPPALRLGNGNNNVNNMAVGAVGMSAIIPGAILVLLAIYIIYRTSKSIYNYVNSEGTPSCKK